jgi:hypothetical protein
MTIRSLTKREIMSGRILLVVSIILINFFSNDLILNCINYKFFVCQECLTNYRYTSLV